MIFKSCSKCGKIHSPNFKCNANPRIYPNAEDRKLRSQSKWKYKSLEIREKANYLCEVCRDQGIINYNSLEVHHIEKLKTSADLLLENYNLICLCQEHHRQADAGELSKEYLRRLAKDREDK